MKKELKKIIVTNSEKDTLRWAEKFAKQLTENDIICLSGQMGAGKSVIVRGIACGIGISEHITSPTFTIVNEYRSAKNLYHFDLYRIDNAEDFFNVGVEEYLSKQGIKILEWADKFCIFPENRYDINIEILDLSKRRIIVTRQN